MKTFHDPFYCDKNITLYHMDSLKLLKNIKSNSIDMVFADPPYFLSNGGITCNSGQMVPVHKGNWDKSSNISIDKFNYTFLAEVKRILTNDGTVWVSGTMHNIYSLGTQLQRLNFKILNNITWEKTSPPPNLSCRMFTHSTENIIWAKKTENSKHTFNYDLMKNENGGKQMKDIWKLGTAKPSEKRFGSHPTQKPLALLSRIIKASTNEGDTILDPFIGSGTTAVVAKLEGRKCIGIDLDTDYLNIASKRVSSVNFSIQETFKLW